MYIKINNIYNVNCKKQLINSLFGTVTLKQQAFTKPYTLHLGDAAIFQAMLLSHNARNAEYIISKFGG